MVHHKPPGSQFLFFQHTETAKKYQKVGKEKHHVAETAYIVYITRTRGVHMLF